MLEKMIKESLQLLQLPYDKKYIDYIVNDLIYFDIVNTSLWSLITSKEYLQTMIKNCDLPN